MFVWMLTDFNATPLEMNGCGLPLRESKVLREYDGPKYVVNREFCRPNLRQSPLLPAKSSLNYLLDHAIMFVCMLMDFNATPLEMNGCGLPLREQHLKRQYNGP